MKKCLFCSFAVTIGQAHRGNDYIRALEIEALQYQGRVLRTVCLGGGTPSFLSDGQLEDLAGIVRGNFIVPERTEWSIEVNPDGMDDSKARTLKKLGFTRISLGIQSFNDAYLKFLGRAHDSSGASRAFEVLRAVGFDNVSVDLMYGFPQQTREELGRDLEMMAGLKPDHVSLYTLTIEPNSRFYARQMKLDDDEKLADDYVFVCAFLANAGFGQYEISNFARPGFESRHNRVYWQGGDYVGLGMGAHSLLGNRRFWNVPVLAEYLDGIHARGHAVEGQEELPETKRLLERLVFGLRTNAGVCLSVLEKQMSLEFSQETKALMDGFIQDGFLCQEDGYVKTTMRGRLVLDELSSRLI